MPHIAIIINSRSGKDSKKVVLQKILTEEKYVGFSLIDFDIHTLKNDISDLIAKGYTTIVAAGGDGTVSAVAGAVVSSDTEVKLGVLPLGTYNHFAKDLELPLTTVEALDVILKGNSSFVDIGKVNDIYFINNSSLGLYPKVVKYREEYMKKGWRKGFAFIAALFVVLQSKLLFTVQFNSDTKKNIRETSFVFVGNNKYELGGFGAGERKQLDLGLLSVCVAKKVGVVKLLLFIFHTLKGTLVEHTDFNVIGLRECTITGGRKSVDVSHDGEVSRLSTPLHYQILPKKLKVIIPQS